MLFTIIKLALLGLFFMFTVLVLITYARNLGMRKWVIFLYGYGLTGIGIWLYILFNIHTHL